MLDEHDEALNGTSYDDSDDDEPFVYSEEPAPEKESNVDAEPARHEVGDYATQLSDLLGSDNEEEKDDNEDDDGDDDEGFVYSGADADQETFNYDGRMRDVMGSEHDSEEAKEVETSLLVEEDDDDEVLPDAADVQVETPLPATPTRTWSPLPGSTPGTPSKLLARPFLHPHVSRLRSFIPQSPSSTSLVTGNSAASVSQLSSLSHLPQKKYFAGVPLRSISQHIFASAAHKKAAALLGSEAIGTPTVLAANGLICVGSDLGRVCVYDFKQNLKCICGSTSDDLGSVTALALSHDHTFIAVGHATGHIRLYDLKNPGSPAARCPSYNAKHRLLWSKGRHTAIVSADEHGLAFYHSLGKVLFVEATDILRILGKYPIDDPHPTVGKRKSRYTVLSLGPLPLGTTPHPTDTYNLVALLTPTKLVVTWFKCSRSDTIKGSEKNVGTLAWFPSVTGTSTQASTPALVYSWGSHLHVIRVTETKAVQSLKTTRTGKAHDVQIGTITYTSVGSWSTENGPILNIQWLNVNQLLVITPSHIEALDVNSLKSVEKVSFDGAGLACPPRVEEEQQRPNVTHSIRTYKGKIFVLSQTAIQVGTLLTWADRILSFVQEGDFLNAIELTRSYYLGTAPGNTNGLPDDVDTRKDVVGKKMRDLMVASATYAFSEDRMTDGTHNTPDGRGVDRTSLFEELVSTCCRACVALDDTDFLFEDLFQYYDDNGISSIFIRQLEPFLMDHEIPYVPPRITKRLIGLHDDEGKVDLIERVIWHVDPLCLDIDQAITLCQLYGLYDALIYTTVAPIVTLLGLIRSIFRARRTEDEEEIAEDLILNAYKIYAYLSSVLAGLEYPSEQVLDADEAAMAKKTVYTFLFFGRSSLWPAGEGGKLVLTADEDGGMEPTYPYARQLLRFDAESFLHSLDIAFEDTYLNGQTQSVSRSLIIRILLEIISSGDFSTEDVTFVNIFIARNVPKYPQFLQDIPPSTLHNILTSLAEDPDIDTRDDRQLAAEFLLSVYNPHESERIITLFQAAGFYRILRTWHRQERRWAPLLSTYIDDSTLAQSEVFDHLDEVLKTSTQANHGHLPPELIQVISDALPHLLNLGVEHTAALIDKHVIDLHQFAFETIGEEQEEKRFAYLRHLLGPPSIHDSEYGATPRPPKQGPSPNLPPYLRQCYVTLYCKYKPLEVISALKYLPSDSIPLPEVLHACEEHGVYDAIVWAIDRDGQPVEALRKLDGFEKKLTLQLVEVFSASFFSSSEVGHIVESLETLVRVGVDVCTQRSREMSAEVPLEDIWFQLLSSQINSVQSVSACCSPGIVTADSAATLQGDDTQVSTWETLSSLRTLIRDTFSALVSITSTRVVSFPRLFTRLVDSVPRSSSETQYAEFRTILTGMLESYRSDGDMLVITKSLAIEEVTKERNRGWALPRGACSICRSPLLVVQPKNSGRGGAVTPQIVVSRCLASSA
ncbi:Golgi CORVET complex core vacuolar protein 8-domain-containing protein [Flagelloscypha sp. PMI_526]|nr:Golgi CORVET complex core vacuolar protein 8-domain-containing protein [Flagelloscypha sp. PMI_526]